MIASELDQNYDRCVSFGEKLIATQDLDPVYTAIVGAKLDDPQLSQLLIAYWCFYHLGAAAYLSEAEPIHYWWKMKEAAENFTLSPAGGRWPRGAERRHFRGEKCVKAIGWLSSRPATSYLDELTLNLSATEVMKTVQQWPLFGPWVAFKVADMIERVYGYPVRFEPSIPMMYEEPRAALNLLPDGSYQRLLSYFSRLKAPPTFDRVCGPQEVETILCKFKSSTNGHYPVGKDIREVRHGLIGWGKTAERLFAAAPEEVGS